MPQTKQTIAVKRMIEDHQNTAGHIRPKLVQRIEQVSKMRVPHPHIEGETITITQREMLFIRPYAL